MLKAVLNKTEFEALDGTMQAFYSEKEGKYYLTVTPGEGFELANTVNLKTSLQKERKRAEDAEKKVKVFETEYNGITDPQAARDALGRVDELASFDPEKTLAPAKAEFEKQMTAKYDKEREKLVSDHTTALEKLQKKNGVYQNQLQGALITNAAQQALIAAGARGDGQMLLPHVEKNVRMNEKENGIFEVEIIGVDGTARLTPKGGSTAKMTIPELVEEMKTRDEYAPGFKGAEAVGGGAAPSAGSGITSSGDIVLSPEQAKDPKVYRDAKDRAGKAGKNVVIKGTT